MEHRIAELEHKVQTLEQYIEGDRKTKIHLIDRQKNQTDVITRYLKGDDQHETDRGSI